MARKITSPEEFFGFKLGSDRKIARWDRIVEYLYRLEQESSRIKVVNMGSSTEGHPFLLAIITSPGNLAKLEHYREVNAKITDPRGLSEEEAKVLIAEGKAIVVQSMSLHASEIGGTQMAPEMAYDMLVADDKDTMRILDNVIYLMVPCFNPDGQIMVADWYNKNLNTEYEGGNIPYLYHKYAGHDNNRDAFALNLVESQYMAKILFRDWHPHAFQDHHHMGSYGARYFLAPYCDPVRPDVDPLVWRELSWYGAHMAYKLEEAGKQGVLNGGQFPGWGHYGFHWITNSHNIAGMLTESASANLATPKYIHSSQLVASKDKSFPEYQQQTNFPNPWPGGWWRLRDIVEQQKISALALLDIAARNRETVLHNAYLKAMRQTRRGEEDKVYAYIVSSKQHDPLTAHKLVHLIINQGIEVKVAKKAFSADGRSYPKETFVVFLQQPKRGVITNLLGRIRFPYTYWASRTDGTPMIYDTTTDNVADFMGVTLDAIEAAFTGEFDVVDKMADIAADFASSGAYYVFDGKLNDSYKLANRLLHQGCDVWRLEEELKMEGNEFVPGSFIVKSSDADTFRGFAQELGVSLYGIDEVPKNTCQVEQLRVGVYQRYWGGNVDEGWTRLLLEKFEFPFVTVMDEDIRAGNLIDKIDVLVLPSDYKQLVVDVTKPDNNQPRAAMMLKWFGNTVPPEYKSGIGVEGVEAIKEFVEKGGRLVALHQSCNIAIDILELNVENRALGLKTDEYLTHGATLRVNVNNTHRLGYGMPQEALALNWESPILKVSERFRADKYQPIVTYAKEDVLQNGLLKGEDLLKGQAAMLSVGYGEGEVVLIGFMAQHRVQTHGTFKLFFNCLL